jgi:hypothetical protein
MNIVSFTIPLSTYREVEKRFIFMSTTKAQHVAWQRYGVVQLGSPRGARRFPFVECSGDG